MEIETVTVTLMQATPVVGIAAIVLVGVNRNDYGFGGQSPYKLQFDVLILRSLQRFRV